ncbi:uncharacterized protein SPPG_07866 [Spizellomyces punctatus DAOM BR117]|uniref:carbonic anhydrase n=1 Tax=Spizellomyces punctatus (strain DAOM BR117) TaxID=645134 RepID=A0A0L0H7J0_SPIPD|nr:uncharacterized protein SPPG_07866 [Spizellomyces punctatus DAOM BR117]KNC96653.1 hypothetical protein SPPG_07866 [Spizellomyces punctatus DAOM BR117]|eukprot:XP_016604693.1 hypothetical protein SPPG_07866 [Spizellomyces punctatus DAOM BR117]
MSSINETSSSVPVRVLETTSGAPESPREFSPISAETIVDRIRRANEEIVPAHSHTLASLRVQQSKEALLGGDQEEGGGEAGATRTPTIRRMGSRVRQNSTKGAVSPGDVLKTLPKPNPAGDIHHAKMTKFLSGFRRFHKRFFANNNSLFENLQHGQAPKTLLIGCCDSRCDPAIITDCDPGDLFVIRNVANLIPPYSPNDDQTLHGTSAAMEFAVKGLKVENIIVMGHTQCGGISALLKGHVAGYEFIESWMKIAQQAKETALKNFANMDHEVQARACEHASILCSLENLVTYPWIRDRLATGEISINGWYFDFKSGDLLAYNPETNAFESLVLSETPATEENPFENLPSGKVEAEEIKEPRSAPIRDAGVAAQ